MQEGKVDFIPSFLKAKSPEILRGLMLRNNAKYGIMFKYYDIQFAQGYWWAWFNVSIGAEEVFTKEQGAKK